MVKKIQSNWKNSKKKQILKKVRQSTLDSAIVAHRRLLTGPIDSEIQQFA